MMPERIEKLRGIVKELEAELESLESVDAQARTVLEDALDDLRTALSKTDAASLESDSLVERLRTAEQEFQVSHPTLSGLVLRMINALGQLGI
jgi:hypothetical protein